MKHRRSKRSFNDLLKDFPAARDAVVASVAKIDPKSSAENFGTPLGDMLRLRSILHELMDHGHARSSARRLVKRYKSRRTVKKKKKNVILEQSGPSVFIVNTGQTLKVGSHRNNA